MAHEREGGRYVVSRGHIRLHCLRIVLVLAKVCVGIIKSGVITPLFSLLHIGLIPFISRTRAMRFPVQLGLEEMNGPLVAIAFSCVVWTDPTTEKRLMVPDGPDGVGVAHFAGSGW